MQALFEAAPHGLVVADGAVGAPMCVTHNMTARAAYEAQCGGAGGLRGATARVAYEVRRPSRRYGVANGGSACRPW